MVYQIPTLPLDIDLETKAVLKQTTAARSALAELKGAAGKVSNQSIFNLIANAFHGGRTAGSANNV